MRRIDVMRRIDARLALAINWLPSRHVVFVLRLVNGSLDCVLMSAFTPAPPRLSERSHGGSEHTTKPSVTY
jgi:hypothetical protein